MSRRSLAVARVVIQASAEGWWTGAGRRPIRPPQPGQVRRRGLPRQLRGRFVRSPGHPAFARRISSDPAIGNDVHAVTVHRAQADLPRHAASPDRGCGGSRSDPGTHCDLHAGSPGHDVASWSPQRSTGMRSRHDQAAKAPENLAWVTTPGETRTTPGEVAPRGRTSALGCDPVAGARPATGVSRVTSSRRRAPSRC